MSFSCVKGGSLCDGCMECQEFQKYEGWEEDAIHEVTSTMEDVISTLQDMYNITEEFAKDIAITSIERI